MIAARPPGPLGILGGTFDPIHVGHLRLGEEAIQQLSLAKVRFIPAGQPPLRDAPCASADHRLAMVKLATAGNAHFEVDDREVNAKDPSYTVDTLKRLRNDIGPFRSLVLVLGKDAFERVDQWHRWQEIFLLAHIAVATRPNATYGSDSPVGAGETNQETKTTTLQGGRAKDALCAVACGDTSLPSPLGNTPLECSPALAEELAQRRGVAVDLASTSSGRIVPFSIPALDISATAIRRMLKTGNQPRYLVAEAVVRYIDLHHIYH